MFSIIFTNVVMLVAFFFSFLILGLAASDQDIKNPERFAFGSLLCITGAAVASFNILVGVIGYVPDIIKFL